MVVVPGATLVTRPVLLTVATERSEDTHGDTTAGDAEPVSWEVAPMQIPRVPLMVGSGSTVITLVEGQPSSLIKITVISPTETPVTFPVLSMVAISGSELVHGEEDKGFPEPVSVILSPTQTLSGPEIKGDDTTVSVSVALHPLDSV